MATTQFLLQNNLLILVFITRTTIIRRIHIKAKQTCLCSCRLPKQINGILIYAIISEQIIIVQSCPILIKFCVVIVRSLVYMYTNFRQNRTIFRPYFGCETHIKGRDNPKFWYFSSFTKLWKLPKFEKNPQFRSWG